MWRGLYTAATGMITETRRTDVIANNLSNAATTGYKKDMAINKEFEPMLIKRFYDHDNKAGVLANGILDTVGGDVTKFKGFKVDQNNAPTVGRLGLGSYTDEISVDHSQGSFESTGNAFDLAIAGEGYFTIQTPQGIRYTRNGAFFRNQNGVLQDIRGYNLLDRQGDAITIPADISSSNVSIGVDGTILVNGQPLMKTTVANEPLPVQIQVVQFDHRLAIQKQGDNLFYAVNNAQPQPATGEIMQGMLEKSNVEIVREMVELIHNHRLYEANSKAVTTQDTMLDTSVNQLGRLGS
jgi:flagellar basal-body rod protein FlgG